MAAELTVQSIKDQATVLRHKKQFKCLFAECVWFISVLINFCVYELQFVLMCFVMSLNDYFTSDICKFH